jgi:hypothetical protein
MSFQLSKEVTKMPYYALFIIFIAAVIIIGGKLYLDQDISIGGVENNLAISRMIYSQECLAGDNLGEINLAHFNENQITQCSGIKDGSSQGMKLEFYYLDNSSRQELEFNKEVVTPCLVDPEGNRHLCEYSQYYFTDQGKGGILEILVANVRE